LHAFITSEVSVKTTDLDWLQLASCHICAITRLWSSNQDRTVPIYDQYYRKSRL